MANVEIADLPSAISLDGSEIVPIVQAGTTKRTTTAAISAQTQPDLDALSSTQGATLYRNASAWVALSPGTSGQVLTTGGGAANPSWVSASTVTSVAISGGTTGLSVSGSPITTSGTITLSGTLGAANGGTGLNALGTGIATWLGTPSSANLASAVTDETGSGALVFGTSPGFTTAANPSSSDGAALGTASLMWSDLFLASGSVINFNNGDVTLTHAANTLTFAGASTGYVFDSVVTLAAGAAATPSLTTTGDLNTGLWFPASDTLALSTGGTEWLRVDSAGKVGIGRTPTTYAFEVEVGGGNNIKFGNFPGNLPGIELSYLTSAYGGVFAQADNSVRFIANYAGGGSSWMTFYTGAAERMRVAADGKVGIGRTPTTYLLEVAGAVNIALAAANLAGLVSTGYSLTGSNATSLIDLAGTWNTSGTPTAFKFDITDTASNASSLLFDFLVGGVSKGKLSKAGELTTAGTVASGNAVTAAGVIIATSTSSAGNFMHSGSTVAITAGGSVDTSFRSTSTTTFGIYFGSGTPTISAAKGSLYLRSDGSGVADRAYINTDGSTAWTAIATAA